MAEFREGDYGCTFNHFWTSTPDLKNASDKRKREAESSSFPNIKTVKWNYGCTFNEFWNGKGCGPGDAGSSYSTATDSERYHNHGCTFNDFFDGAYGTSGPGDGESLPPPTTATGFVYSHGCTFNDFYDGKGKGNGKGKSASDMRSIVGDDSADENSSGEHLHDGPTMLSTSRALALPSRPVPNMPSRPFPVSKSMMPLRTPPTPPNSAGSHVASS